MAGEDLEIKVHCPDTPCMEYLLETPETMECLGWFQALRLGRQGYADGALRWLQRMHNAMLFDIAADLDSRGLFR